MYIYIYQFPFWNGLFAAAKTGCYIKRIRVPPGFFFGRHQLTPRKIPSTRPRSPPGLCTRGIFSWSLWIRRSEIVKEKKRVTRSLSSKIFLGPGTFKKHLGWKHVNDDVFIALPWKYTDMTSDIPTYSEV